ncbi:MAG: PilN domain-containing protein [Candidatus Omnitrophota bacterium]|nr:PilN domain-containing protein [Candidatus Omnitrophota bacterium]
MRRTNLIPQALLSAQSRFTFKTQLEYSLFIGGVVILALFVTLEIFQLIGIGIFAYQAKLGNNKLISLTRELRENTKARENVEAQIKSWRDKAAQTKERMAFLEEEVKGGILWSGVLEKLNSFVPARLWLIKLSLGKDIIKIKGNTYDNLLISTFISNLSNSEFFTEIALNYAQKSKLKEGVDGEGGREVIEFEITCRMKGIGVKQNNLSDDKEATEKGANK